MEFSINICAILIMGNRKRQMTEEKNEKARRKGNLQVLRNMEAEAIK